MIDVGFELFVAVMILLGLSLVFGLWIFYDRRDRHLYDAQRMRHAFHCVRCSTIYSAQGGREVAECPHCGFSNARLKF